MNKNITEKVMKQYEAIRKLGACNMFDFNCVQRYADKLEMYDLASIDRNDYGYILQNFSKLMTKFNIQQ